MEKTSLEENLPLVNYIMLARIYDLLSVIASAATEQPEVIQNIVNMHAQGQILGPLPAYTPQAEQEDDIKP